MTILLTGAAGYIGSHCYYALAEREGKENLAVLDDYSTGRRSMLPEDAVCYEGNVGDVKRLDAIFAKHTVEAVIHFAGSVVVPESVEHPGKYYANNTCNSLALMKACAKHKVRNFIFSSTASVYGNGTGNPCKESDPTAPMNPYAASKLMTEMIIKDFHLAHGVNYAILRYFNVAGADQHLRCGQASPIVTHLIRVTCQAALGLQSHVPVFGADYGTPDGTCIRDYIHVSDLAEAHVSVFELLRSATESKPVGEVFNCGYGRGYSVKEVLDAFEQETGRNIRRVVSERRAGDPESLVADSSRLVAVTGWKPERDNLGEIVRSALAWEEKLAAGALG